MKAKQELIDFVKSSEFEKVFKTKNGYNYPLIKMPMKYDNGYHIYFKISDTETVMELYYFLSISKEGQIYNLQCSQYEIIGDPFAPLSHYLKEYCYNLLEYQDEEELHKIIDDNDKKIDIMGSKRKEVAKKIQEKWNKEFAKEYDYQDLKKNHENMLFSKPRNPIGETMTLISPLSRDFISAYNSSNLDEFIEEQMLSNKSYYKEYYYIQQLQKDFVNEVNTSKKYEKERILLDLLNNKKIFKIRSRIPNGSLYELFFKDDMDYYEVPSAYKKDLFKYHTIDGLILDSVEEIIDEDGNILYNKPIDISLRELAFRFLTNEDSGLDEKKSLESFNDDKEIAEIALLKRPSLYDILDPSLKFNTDFISDTIIKMDDEKKEAFLGYLDKHMFYDNKNFTLKVINIFENDMDALNDIVTNKANKKNIDEQIILKLLDIYKKIDKEQHAYQLQNISVAIQKNIDVLKNDEIKQFAKNMPIEDRLIFIGAINDFNLLTDIFTIDELALYMEKLNDDILKDIDVITVLFGSNQARPLFYNTSKTLEIYRDNPDIVKLICLSARDTDEARLFMKETDYMDDMDFIQEIMCLNYSYFGFLDDENKKYFLENEGSSIKNAKSIITEIDLPFSCDSTESYPHIVFETENGEIVVEQYDIALVNHNTPYGSGTCIRDSSTVDMYIPKFLEDFINTNLGLSEKFTGMTSRDIFERLQEIIKEPIGFDKNIQEEER